MQEILSFLFLSAEALLTIAGTLIAIFAILSIVLGLILKPLWDNLTGKSKREDKKT